MHTISIVYKAKWQIKDKPNYKWTECKKLINAKTGKVIKKTLKGLTPGYWIEKEFISLQKLKNRVELIKKEKCPF